MKEKIRPRIKPIKSASKSVDLSSKEASKSYKDQYNQFRKTSQWARVKSDQLDSEEELQQPAEIIEEASTGSFRFYNNVKKYRKFASYIE